MTTPTNSDEDGDIGMASAVARAVAAAAAEAARNAKATCRYPVAALRPSSRPRSRGWRQSEAGWEGDRRRLLFLFLVVVVVVVVVVVFVVLARDASVSGR